MNRLLWPGMLFVLIGAVVVLDVTMIVVAGSDPAFDVKRGAENGDAAWGEQRERDARARALGWRIEPHVTSRAGAIDFYVTVTNGDDAPLTGADVSVEAFHNARPRDVATMDVPRLADGRFTAALAAERQGRWRYRLVITRGEDQIITDGIVDHEWSAP